MGVWVDVFLRRIGYLSFRGDSLWVVSWFRYEGVVEGLSVCSR